MSGLSATELSRLHRQRRLECSSPRPSVTLLKRRPRKKVGDDDASKTDTSVVSQSFDDEVTSATSFDNHKDLSNGNETPQSTTMLNGNGTPSRQPARSFSFSSFSDASVAGKQCISFPQVQTTLGSAAIVSPPASPARSGVKSHRILGSGARHHLPASPLGSALDGKTSGKATSPQRRSISRSSSSSSTKSLPLALAAAPVTPNGQGQSYSDMPLDELMASSNSKRRASTGTGRTSSQQPYLEKALVPHESSSLSILESRSMGASPISVLDPDQYASTLTRMAHALNQRQGRPANMTDDEQHLWDVIESLITTKDNASPSYWEQKYEQRELEWTSQQKEHDRALLAIQRVLADVTTEREETVTRLKEELERSQEQRDDTILKLTKKLREMQKEMKKQPKKEPVETKQNNEGGESEGQSDLVVQLRHQLDALQAENDDLQKKMEAKEEQSVEANRSSDAVVQNLKDDNEKKTQQIDQLQQEVKALRVQTSTAAEDGAKLRETNSSLENAKMIIASLENANGSLARELRAKLKEKEDDLATLTKTSAEREQTLDGLVTELKALKRQQPYPRMAKKHLTNQRDMCRMLEKNVSALRQAAVQHEARNDQASVDKISSIVSETFTSLKHNLESWDAFLKNVDAMEMTSEPDKSEQHNLEKALAKKDDETKKLRKELERLKVENKMENTQLKQEINSLKDRLANNMEILAKKGRELSVLRDSLAVEDNVGYISDDGTDGYETEPEAMHGPSSAQTLQAAGSKVDEATEIQLLRNEIIEHKKEREAKAVELQAEKESLANAKMIISSLEKANKSMLEDLRSRLQDSNTAIASLLDKSLEHEKTIATLRQELKTERQEREKDEQKLKSHMAKLKDENLVFSVRLAAKDREIEELQASLEVEEGQEVTIGKTRLSSVEEKKDDETLESEDGN